MQNNIRIGLSAKLLLNELNKTQTKCGEYMPSSSGIFKDVDGFIAFDNRTCECWVESFNDINDAFKWVKEG